MKINFKKIVFQIQTVMAAIIIIMLIAIVFQLGGIIITTIIFSIFTFLSNLIMEVANLDIFTLSLIAGILFVIACFVVGYKTSGPKDKPKEPSMDQKRKKLEENLARKYNKPFIEKDYEEDNKDKKDKKNKKNKKNK